MSQHTHVMTWRHLLILSTTAAVLIAAIASLAAETSMPRSVPPYRRVCQYPQFDNVVLHVSRPSIEHTIAEGNGLQASSQGIDIRCI